MRSFGALVLCLIAQLCANVLAAAPISQSLSLFQPSNVNSSNPYNLTLPTSYNALPSDPSIYTVPQSTQQILFSRYSRTLPQKDVLSCLLQAANMVIKELNKENFGPIDTEDIQTSSGIAHLIFYPASKMTWGMVRYFPNLIKSAIWPAEDCSLATSE